MTKRMALNDRVEMKYMAWEIFRDLVMKNELDVKGISCVFGGADIGNDME